MEAGFSFFSLLLISVSMLLFFWLVVVVCKLVSQRLLKKGIGSKEGEIVEASEKKIKKCYIVFSLVSY